MDLPLPTAPVAYASVTETVPIPMRGEGPAPMRSAAPDSLSWSTVPPLATPVTHLPLWPPPTCGVEAKIDLGVNATKPRSRLPR